MQPQNSKTKSDSKIRFITNLLTTAVKLFLKSQVSHIEELSVEIKAGDRQLLSGAIPQVSIFASNAVYKGIHVTQIKLVAENIRINIGGVLKGQALKLLDIVPVQGELSMSEADLNASLSSEFLSNGINDALVQLLPESSRNSKSTIWQKITLGHNLATICGTMTPETDPKPIEVCLRLNLLSGQKLHLTVVNSQCIDDSLSNNSINDNFYLGSDVDIQELALSPGSLTCRGRVNVNP